MSTDKERAYLEFQLRLKQAQYRNEKQRLILKKIRQEQIAREAERYEAEIADKRLKDIEGEYLEAIFRSKPSEEKLTKVLTDKGMIDDTIVSHLLSGGGRRDSEYIWFNLREEPLI